MSKELLGIHHVTAITSDPQRNVDFYTGVLGLRLVKLTVNFDDPGSYHLYYGDELGHPGTIMTFFAWPGAQKGRQGTFTSRFFIKRPPEPHEPWTLCSSFWEPKALLATVPARSDPPPVHHLGSICRQW
jgi:catechol 2,3-dioxygenase-like lactoylglutathione lyase family enzyme